MHNKYLNTQIIKYVIFLVMIVIGVGCTINKTYHYDEYYFNNDLDKKVIDNKKKMEEAVKTVKPLNNQSKTENVKVNK